jgi:hypothetical protein
MMTESKLRKALDKLDHRQKGKSPGRPMSGLSIPADYYLGRADRKVAVVARGKSRAKMVAGK